jgi:hypothetical protein
MTTEERAIVLLKSLPLEKQQAVLSFIESLQRSERDDISRKSISVLEAAGDLVGCVEGGPSDLSTNKEYMQGFGA